MKKIIFLALMISQISFAQKYYTKTGSTQFKASVQAFEEVAAKNNSTSAVLKTTSGDFAALLFVKAFRFKIALMEEHFNENYMDSDLFPKATFKGKIHDFSIHKLNHIEQDFTLSGLLTIHGVTKKVTTIARLKSEGEKLVIVTNFMVRPSDFNIKIPSIVKDKIAKEINISTYYELIKK